MKNVAFVLLALLLTPLTGWSADCQFKGDGAKPHAIFLIHGLMANADSFGDAAQLLHETYAQNCKKNVRVHTIEYFTNPSREGGILNFHRVQTLHPYDFAKVAYADMKAFLTKQAAIDRINGVPSENQFSLDTPYSIMVHSQGGITAMSILQSCIQSELEDNDEEQRCDYNAVLNEYQTLEDEDGNPHEKWNEDNLLTTEFVDNNGETRTVRVTPEEMYSQPAANIKNLITFGTPFWGSPTANKGVSLENFIDGFISTIFKVLKKTYPKEQISRLAIGGRGTSFQRIFMLNRPRYSDFGSNPEWEGLFDGQLNTYNVSGLLPTYDPAYREAHLDGVLQNISAAIVNMFANPIYYENDIIVGNPEARVDFNYFIQNIDKGQPSWRGQTKMAGQEQFYPFHLSHIPMFDDKVMGIANILRKDIEIHPSWLLIQKVLNKEFGLSSKSGIESLITAGSDSEIVQFSQTEKNENFVERLKNFTSEIKLVTPRGYHRKINIRESHVSAANKAPKDVYDEIVLASSLYVKTLGIHPDGLKIKHHYGQSIYHVGSFKDAFAFSPKTENLGEITNTLYDKESNQTFQVNGYPLEYTIDLPGFHKTSFTQAVLPSFNSYAEIFLDTYLPFDHTWAQTGPIASIVAGVETGTRNEVVREFYLDGKGILKTRVKRLKEMESTDRVGQCHVGMTGNATPTVFRYQTRKEDGSRKMTINKIRFNDESFFKWAETWKQLAQNKIELYSQVNSNRPEEIRVGHFTQRRKEVETVELTMPIEELEQKSSEVEVVKSGFVLATDKTTNIQGREMVKLQFNYPPSVRPRKAIEILGRVTQVPMINGKPLLDIRAKTGRACSLVEEDLFGNACDVEFVDRYLITSYEIRREDGLKTFESIGSKTITDKDGNELPAGVRWINVVDVDVFRPDQKVPVGVLTRQPGPYVNNHFNDTRGKGFVKGDECLKDRYDSLSSATGASTRIHYRHGVLKATN